MMMTIMMMMMMMIIIINFIIIIIIIIINIILYWRRLDAQTKMLERLILEALFALGDCAFVHGSQRA